jgi:hypothetical protein
VAGHLSTVVVIGDRIEEATAGAAERADERVSRSNERRGCG